MIEPKPAEPTGGQSGRRRPARLAGLAVGGLAVLLLAVLTIWRAARHSPPRLEMPVPIDWKVVDAGGRFTFRAPADLRAVPVQGIDSFVGKYRSDSLTLSFDYGWYSNALDNEQPPGFRKRRVAVSGFTAKLVEYSAPASSQPYVVAIHFPDLGNGHTRLTLEARGKTAADREDALRIFSSVEISPVGN